MAYSDNGFAARGSAAHGRWRQASGRFLPILRRRNMGTGLPGGFDRLHTPSADFDHLLRWFRWVFGARS